MKNIFAAIWGLIADAPRAFADASPMSRGMILGVPIFIFLLIVEQKQKRPTEADMQAAIDRSYEHVDRRYIEAANRQGYTGRDAEQIGAAAARLCRGTGGSDC